MRAADRLFAVLEAVAERDHPASATEIAGEVKLSLSTTSRLMRELEADRLLERAPGDASYALGPRFLHLARTSIQSEILVAAATPVMHELRDLTGETVSLHVRQQDIRVCIAQVESRHRVRRVMPVGFSAPLHGGATSEVLLAALTPDALESYLDMHAISESDRRLIKLRLAEIDRDGWSLSVDTVEQGLAGMGVAVRDREHIAAVMSVSGPSSRWTVSLMQSFAPDILSAVHRVSAQVSGDRRGSARTPPQVRRAVGIV